MTACASVILSTQTGMLQGGLVGSSGSGMRMKDWDKALEESDDEEPGHAQHTDVDSSDDSSGQDD